MGDDECPHARNVQGQMMVLLLTLLPSPVLYSKSDDVQEGCAGPASPSRRRVQ